jgi:predicted transcriptional regulator
MKKASRATYKVGSIGEFAAWTKRVVSDPRAALEHPKKWFGSEEAAAHAEQVSAEAMVKLLSPGNLAVLQAIKRHKPGSVRELATLTGRKEASLSRTLKRFAQLGIVAFEDGRADRAFRPSWRRASIWSLTLPASTAPSLSSRAD